MTITEDIFKEKLRTMFRNASKDERVRSIQEMGHYENNCFFIPLEYTKARNKDEAYVATVYAEFDSDLKECLLRIRFEDNARITLEDLNESLPTLMPRCVTWTFGICGCCGRKHVVMRLNKMQFDNLALALYRAYTICIRLLSMYHIPAYGSPD